MTREGAAARARSSSSRKAAASARRTPPTRAGPSPLDRAPEDAAGSRPAKPPERRRRDRRDDADELRLLIDYHNCRVFVRDGDDLRPIAFWGDLTATGSAMEVCRPASGEGVRGTSPSRESPLRATRPTADRRPDPRGRRRSRSRFWQCRCATARRWWGSSSSRSWPRPVRLGRAPPARGPGRPRLRGARQCQALRVGAARGGEREGAAGADARTLRRDEPRRCPPAGRPWRGPHHGLEPLLDLAAHSRRWARESQRRRRLGVHVPPGAHDARRARRALLAARRAVDDVSGGGGADREDGRRPRGRGDTRGCLHPARPGPRRPRRRRGGPDPLARARAPRGNREPGTARDHERRELRDARAHVPLDGRGARERTRGEGLVHLVARPLDLRYLDRGRAALSARSACS